MLTKMFIYCIPPPISYEVRVEENPIKVVREQIQKRRKESVLKQRVREEGVMEDREVEERVAKIKVHRKQKKK